MWGGGEEKQRNRDKREVDGGKECGEADNEGGCIKRGRRQRRSSREEEERRMEGEGESDGCSSNSAQVFCQP